MSYNKLIIFSFDYELFLGADTGDVENCLIQPTNRILDIFAKHGASAIFFVDTLYLSRLREFAALSERAAQSWKAILNQIERMLKEGHEVFHHLHPHWLFTQYDMNRDRWTKMAPEKFTLETLTEAERETAIIRSTSIMNEIISALGVDYKSTGFRAGGLYITPFKYFINYFNRAGINIDFSVLPGFKSEQKNYGVDFTHVIEETPYNFMDDPCENVDGKYFEFPITVIRVGLSTKSLNWLFNRLFSNSYRKQRWGNGSPSGNTWQHIHSNSLFQNHEIASVENLNPVKYFFYLNEIRQRSYLHLLSHPKLICEQNLFWMEKLLKRLVKNSLVKYSFREHPIYNKYDTRRDTR